MPLLILTECLNFIIKDINMDKKLVNKYVKPHEKISRDVTNDDIKRVKADAKIMHKLCFTPVGNYRGGKAVAHQQICKNDPLRFFVNKENEIVINPVIIRHTKVTIKSNEGCLSFPTLRQIDVDRWHKCEVEVQTLTDDGKLSEKVVVKLSGTDSFIVQHEIGHFECEYIFNIKEDEKTGK